MRNEVSYQFTITGELVELIEEYCRMIGMSKADFFRTASFEKLMLFRTYQQVQSGQVPHHIVAPGIPAVAVATQMQQPPIEQHPIDMKQACINILNHPGFDSRMNEFVQGCLKVLNSNRDLSEKQHAKINQMHFRLTGRNADGSAPGHPVNGNGSRLSTSCNMVFPFSNEYVFMSCKTALDINPENEEVVSLMNELKKHGQLAPVTDDNMQRWLGLIPKMPVAAACFVIPEKEMKPDKQLVAMYKEFNEMGLDTGDKDIYDVMCAFEYFVFNNKNHRPPLLWVFNKDGLQSKMARKAIQYMYEKATGKR